MGLLPAIEEIRVWKTSQVLVLYMAKYLQMKKQLGNSKLMNQPNLLIFMLNLKQSIEQQCIDGLDDKKVVLWKPYCYLHLSYTIPSPPKFFTLQSEEQWYEVEVQAILWVLYSSDMW